MIKEALDGKYSYQIDEYGTVHLFRGEEDCQQHLTNPLLSAIFKIEALKKENAELKEQCLILADCDTCYSPCKNENVENTDIHKLTASRVFNVPYNKVTDEQRRIAKTLNFKKLYK